MSGDTAKDNNQKEKTNGQEEERTQIPWAKETCESGEKIEAEKNGELDADLVLRTDK